MYVCVCVCVQCGKGSERRELFICGFLSPLGIGLWFSGIPQTELPFTCDVVCVLYVIFVPDNCTSYPIQGNPNYIMLSEVSGH